MNSVSRADERGGDIELMLRKLSVEKQAYLTRLLEVSAGKKGNDTSGLSRHNSTSSPDKVPLFRFHKNLATSRYEEFLEESDDEELFKTKPQTKDGRDYELDFKIDAFRDQIRVNKNGSPKKVIAGPASVDRQSADEEKNCDQKLSHGDTAPRA